MNPIYSDYAATAPLVEEAREAMRPWLEGEFGNPSSLHAWGRRAKDAIDEAREILSQSVGCSFGELVFTSSGTEAANLAIFGTAMAALGGNRQTIVASAVEHHCVLHNRERLAKLGYEVRIAPVDRSGRVDLGQLESLLDESVLLVSIMHANNELGTLQPVEKVAELARKCGVLYHCDTVQTFGTLTGFVNEIGCDFATYSAHKIGGPKGVGASYVRAGTSCDPLLVGGGQEREVRAGTENVAGIVGFAAAVQAFQRDGGRQDRKRAARDAFESVLLRGDSDVAFTVPKDVDRLPGHSHLRFHGVSAESMLIRLDRMGVAASSGAACSSGSILPSHVLEACGYSPAEAKEGLRFSFGWNSEVADAHEAAERTLEVWRRIKDA